MQLASRTLHLLKDLECCLFEHIDSQASLKSYASEPINFLCIIALSPCMQNSIQHRIHACALSFMHSRSSGSHTFSARGAAMTCMLLMITGRLSDLQRHAILLTSAGLVLTQMRDLQNTDSGCGSRHHNCADDLCEPCGRPAQMDTACQVEWAPLGRSSDARFPLYLRHIHCALPGAPERTACSPAGADDQSGRSLPQALWPWLADTGESSVWGSL